MASISSSATILLLLLLLHLSFIISSSSISTSSTTTTASKPHNTPSSTKRSVIDSGEEDGKVQNPSASKKKPILATKNQTKLLKPKKNNSTATVATGAKTANTTKIKLGKYLNATTKASNSTKLFKTIELTKLNSTKLLKNVKLPKSNSIKSSKEQPVNSASNSTKSSKSSVLDWSINKNKTASATKAPKGQQPTNAGPAKMSVKPKAKPVASTAWMEAEDNMDGADLISDFRELPSHLLPDLERLTTTSKAYISAANKGIAEGVKPYVGKGVASKIATVLSSLFLALPLLLLTLLFRRLRSYLSLHLLLLFIQAYLAIYFCTLALTALVTGLEPLRFFYATSPSSYTWTQAAQTMGYLVYLVLQLADLVAVFSGGKDAAASTRVLALAQMVIGLAVGMHYYAAIFHRAVSGEPPRTNWRVHGVYAACFLVSCACARAERRKKAYYEGEDGKNS